MTLISGDICVTTWGLDTEGQQTWRARSGDRTVEFTARRDTEAWWLFAVGRILLGQPISENAADLLREI